MSNSPDQVTPGTPQLDNKPSRDGHAAVPFGVGLFIGILGARVLLAAFEPVKGRPVDYKARNALLVKVWIVAVALVVVFATFILRWQGRRRFLAGLVAGTC